MGFLLSVFMKSRVSNMGEQWQNEARGTSTPIPTVQLHSIQKQERKSKAPDE